MNKDYYKYYEIILALGEEKRKINELIDDLKLYLDVSYITDISKNIRVNSYNSNKNVEMIVDLAKKRNKLEELIKINPTVLAKYVFIKKGNQISDFKINLFLGDKYNYDCLQPSLKVKDIEKVKTILDEIVKSKMYEMEPISYNFDFKNFSIDKSEISLKNIAGIGVDMAISYDYNLLSIKTNRRLKTNSIEDYLNIKIPKYIFSDTYIDMIDENLYDVYMKNGIIDTIEVNRGTRNNSLYSINKHNKIMRLQKVK